MYMARVGGAPGTLKFPSGVLSSLTQTSLASDGAGGRQSPTNLQHLHGDPPQSPPIFSDAQAIDTSPYQC